MNKGFDDNTSQRLGWHSGWHVATKAVARDALGIGAGSGMENRRL